MKSQWYMVGEDAAAVNSLEAAKAAVEQQDMPRVSACLADLGQIVEMALTKKVVVGMPKHSRINAQVNLQGMPAFIRDLLPNGIPELPPDCQWHFFISKHEELAKDVAQVIAQYLESLGFKVCSPISRYISLYLDTSRYISLLSRVPRLQG